MISDWFCLNFARRSEKNKMNELKSDLNGGCLCFSSVQDFSKFGDKKGKSPSCDWRPGETSRGLGRWQYKPLPPGAHVGDASGPTLFGVPFVEPSNISTFGDPEGFRWETAIILHTERSLLSGAVMSRSFYVDSLIIKDTVRPGPAEHTGQDFLIPISMHSPSVMTVTAPVCPSRKNGTFCVCPLCVTSHIHSSRSGIPMLKGQFPGAEAQYCQRIAHQQSPALAHPGHTPVCTPTFSVTDPRRYHCLSIGKHLFATLSAHSQELCSAPVWSLLTFHQALWGSYIKAIARLLRMLIYARYFLSFTYLIEFRPALMIRNQISDIKYIFLSSRRLWEQPHTEWQEDAHGFHKHATPGTWKGVFHEHVSFETQKNRNRHVFEPVGETGENLVSEPQGETQEGGQSHPKERTQRLQVHERPHRLFKVRGRGVSISCLCHGGERGVTHLRTTRLPQFPTAGTSSVLPQLWVVASRDVWVKKKKKKISCMKSEKCWKCQLFFISF